MMAKTTRLGGTVAVILLCLNWLLILIIWGISAFAPEAEGCPTSERAASCPSIISWTGDADSVDNLFPGSAVATPHRADGEPTEQPGG